MSNSDWPTRRDNNWREARNAIRTLTSNSTNYIQRAFKRVDAPTESLKTEIPEIETTIIVDQLVNNNSGGLSRPLSWRIEEVKDHFFTKIQETDFIRKHSNAYQLRIYFSKFPDAPLRTILFRTCVGTAVEKGPVGTANPLGSS